MFSIGMLMAYILFKSNYFNNEVVPILGSFGIISALVGGMLYSSTFTVATGALIIFSLSKIVSPFEMVFFGMVGAVICDLIIFKLTKNTLSLEVEGMFEKVGNKHRFWKKLIHTKYFGWGLPLFGAILIASPLPDELAVSIIGISKMKTGQFILLSSLSNIMCMTSIVVTGLIAQR